MPIGLLEEDYVSDFVKISNDTTESKTATDVVSVTDILKVDNINSAHQYVNWVSMPVSPTVQNNYESLCMLEFIKIKMQDTKLTNDEMKILASGDPYGDELRDKLTDLKKRSAELTSEYLQFRVTERVVETNEHSWLEGAIKFRGCYETEAEATECAEQIAKTEPVFPVFSDGVPYKFYRYNQDHTFIENQKTPNNKYNEINKGYHDNVKAVDAQRSGESTA